MTKSSFAEYIVPLLLMFLCGGAVANGQEVNFCLFSLPQGILQANASFNAIYEFDVDKNGVPTNIHPRAKEFTNPSDVRACLEQWKLPDSALKHLVAIFEWHHGVGWTKLAISGPSINLTVHQSGQRCPYGSMAQESANPRGTP